MSRSASWVTSYHKPNTLVKEKLRACLGKLFSSLNFHHPSLITHNSSLITHFFTLICNITFIFITQFFHTIHGSFSSLNFFTLFIGPTPVSRYSFFFLSTQLTEANILKKKKKPEQPTQEKKKEKKKKKRTTSTQKKKKKNERLNQEKKKKMSKGGQKLRL